jgi:hypothetical protein
VLEARSIERLQLEEADQALLGLRELAEPDLGDFGGAVPKERGFPVVRLCPCQPARQGEGFAPALLLEAPGKPIGHALRAALLDQANLSSRGDAGQKL